MATNYIEDGNVLNFTASTDVKSGAVVVLSNRVGVALTDIANGQVGAVGLVGVFGLPKKEGVALTQGQTVYWAPTLNAISDAAKEGEDANVLAGFAYENAAAGDADAAVKLNA